MAVGAPPALAAELAALPVDVIVAGNNKQIAAAQRATSTIPIVMVLGLDPVRNGFIDSYARPGRNITGPTNDTGSAMNGKSAPDVLTQCLRESRRLRREPGHYPVSHGAIWNPPAAVGGRGHLRCN